jgi:Ulp1 family protease
MKANGKTDVGIIFNLDPHDRPGSHWVCAYINLRKMAAYYYDSYGYEPCAQIRRLLRRCREQGCAEIIWNDIRHQRKKSECGTYCMFIIISLLKGASFSELCKNRVDDDTMNSVRDLLYATERPSERAIKQAVAILKL